jgi:hypothetical protein
VHCKHEKMREKYKKKKKMIRKALFFKTIKEWRVRIVNFIYVNQHNAAEPICYVTHWIAIWSYNPTMLDFNDR